MLTKLFFDILHFKAQRAVICLTALNSFITYSHRFIILRLPSQNLSCITLNYLSKKILFLFNCKCLPDMFTLAHIAPYY